MGGNLDYEPMTDVYEERWYTDEYGYPYSQWEWVGRDPAKATLNMGIRAINDANGQVANATLTVNVTDVNEGPVLPAGLRYIIHDDQSNGYFGSLSAYAHDPETMATATSYRVVSVSQVEKGLVPGSSADVDNGYPTVTIASNGSLSFSVPNDGEWEGGVRNHPVYGGRWYFQLDQSITVAMTDQSGVESQQTFMVTFLKHDSNNVLPVVFDLDGDGVELTQLDGATVRFDMDRDGAPDLTGWVAPDDGLLALDRNGNGTIDDSSEISFSGDDPEALTDIEGLRAFDSNADNFIDQADARFADFRVWRDLNQDGVSQANELQTLDEAGIARIGLTIERNLDDFDSQDANRVYATGSFVGADGSIGTVNDVVLGYESAVANQVPDDNLAAPIILDLDKDGTTIVPLAKSTTMFDMAGDGKLYKTAWADPGDAFLVRDRNGNGKIDDIHDISFTGDQVGAKTDLEGLAAFDDNGDGMLDGQDASFVGFGAWRDTNANGVTDAGELLSLAQAGITSIDLKGTATGETAAARGAGQSVTFNTGTVHFGDGTSGAFSDVGLAYATTAVGTAVAANVSFQTTTVATDRKASAFRLSATSGGAAVRPRDPEGVLDAGAGKLSGATLMRFADRSIGMLDAIILDLDNDGFELQSRKKSHATFDMDNDGIADDTGWIGKGDGFLVIDRDDNGKVTAAAELSFLSEKPDAGSSFAALATLDSNKDGKLDKSDTRFVELKVWADANRNGAVDDGELHSLDDLDITALSLKTSPLSLSGKPGENLGLSTATFTRRDGSVATMGEAALAFAPSSLARQLGVADKLGGIPDTTPNSASISRTAGGELPRLDAARLAEAMSAFGVTSAYGDRLSYPTGMREEQFALAAAH